ncbi:unnamed protein product [Rotaria socialis]|uniref:UDENN domain-containing protein n=5 Tax=Rotaria socialis TaxID=392032 RepID=A0A820FKY7_9BILA|nr:unnamed protein product [Rotaria socialis]CAF3369136.1 unnamed protein product [Rotaria socialis]CAF3423650.1 unnamed protein product [Rotaria socialis]CAF3555786.1 unnamed protein product [Rotaria socialis]CAF4264631.1 unnamed protein product [Rotaria socialis]
MKPQLEFDESIVRSGSRIRESVRSLPKGHFQQIRQMFEKQTYPTKKLSTIYERHHKSVPCNGLLRLPVTDDEKLKHTTTKRDHEKPLEERYRDYTSEYQSFRLKLTHEYLQHKTICPLKDDEQLFKQQICLPHENHSNKETPKHSTSLLLQQNPLSKSGEHSSTTSLINKNRPFAMSALMNYADSYDSLTSSSLSRTGSSRHYVSNLQNTLDIHTEPVIMTTSTQTNLLHDNQPTISNETYGSLKASRRVHSSTSLSSTGYDSNSSPSIKSKRNSIATNNSNDCIMHSTCSSSSSSSPSSLSRHKQEQEQQLSKPWIPYESNTINPSFSISPHNDDAFESFNESSPMVSRTEIKLSQPTTDHRPVNIIRHVIVRNSALTTSPSSTTSTHEPVIASNKPNNLSFTVQTTSFSDHTDKKADKKIRRWNNIYAERIEFVNKSNPNRRYPLTSTSSMGFQVANLNNEQEQQTDVNTCSANSEHKPINEQKENPVIQVESPVLCTLPPKKPPRTFEQEKKRNTLGKLKGSKALSSSSSNENSPILDFGARSVSCMDLTASVTNTLLLNDHLPLKQEQTRISRRSEKPSLSNEPSKSSVSPMLSNNDREAFLYNSSQNELNTMHTNTPSFNAPLSKQKTSKKSSMKKGISEPNLTKTSRNRSPFSPRALLDRFKRMLPISLSKQSLNEKPTNHNDRISPQNDSDDTGSTTSENNDNIRTSRLDHVTHVQNICESLSTSNNMSSLLTDPSLSLLTNEITTLYDYVVHILPEQEIGYFSNGNGCILSSNFNQHLSTTAPIHFKYPPDAQDEATLKYFCFPDQLDSNNNPLSLAKKSAQEYFRFTLTNMHGVRQYGYCSRFFHKRILNALCIVSPFDMIEIYEKILSTATELFLSYKENEAKTFLEEIYHHRLPNRGDTIHITTSTVGLYTLKCEYDRRKVLIDSITLLSLSTETIIKIFSSILYEQKLIFIGNEIGSLTRLINTFVCLLYPFSWPHTFVPILPALMLDIVQAPTPYIIGILRSCESYLSGNDDFLSQDNSDILIVDIDHDRIRSIDDYIMNNSHRSSTDNLHHFPTSNQENNPRFQILPKIFKIELKQEISLLRKTRLSLSLDECQQRLHDVFMSIFVQSCYNYKDYFNETFQREEFLQSKQHTIELFLEWFTRTQIFGLFIRQKFEYNNANQFAISFDSACGKYLKKFNKQTPQRVTAKAVKRKSATRANKQDNRF